MPMLVQNVFKAVEAWYRGFCLKMGYNGFIAVQALCQVALTCNSHLNPICYHGNPTHSKFNFFVYFLIS